MILLENGIDFLHICLLRFSQFIEPCFKFFDFCAFGTLIYSVYCLIISHKWINLIWLEFSFIEFKVGFTGRSVISLFLIFVWQLSFCEKILAHTRSWHRMWLWLMTKNSRGRKFIKIKDLFSKFKDFLNQPFWTIKCMVYYLIIVQNDPLLSHNLHSL